MRLSEEQIKAIVHTARGVYGQGVEVFLFGSRTKNTEKGGDIDLMIQAEKTKMTLKNKISFLVSLKKKIGEQKVDVVYDQKGKSTSFMIDIKKERIAL